jgi:FkbM family methyltransferase
MSGLRTAAKFLLYGSPLYRPARKTFLYLFDQERFGMLNDGEKFYARFIKRGDLVFDIGANVGDYTDTFLALGARVVAVEPNPECFEHVKRLDGSGRLSVENMALADHEGFAEFHICKQNDISTLSPDFKRACMDSGRLEWGGSLQVLVTTLDALSMRYGMPDFVKIDTEGFDDKVLQGMSFRPRCLSFEFIAAVLDVARRCLRILGDDYVYNYIVGQRFEFVAPSWLSKNQMCDALEKLSAPQGYGDIVAKRTEYRH